MSNLQVGFDPLSRTPGAGNKSGSQKGMAGKGSKAKGWVADAGTAGILLKPM